MDLMTYLPLTYFGRPSLSHRLATPQLPLRDHHTCARNLNLVDMLDSNLKPFVRYPC